MNELASEKKGYLQYPYLSFRKKVWKEIIDIIERDINDRHLIVELGAGYCDFINQINAEKKIAYDLNPEMIKYASAHVKFEAKNAVQLEGLNNSEVSVFFASNFLEHLTEEEAEELIKNIYHKLKPTGQLILIQPNYRLCKKHYFDDPTHKTIYTERSLAVFLEKNRFKVTKNIAGFLPFSMKSRLPKWPSLVRLYLKLPYKPMAAQMYIVAERR